MLWSFPLCEQLSLSLDWLTDVLTGLTGTEQRRMLRQHPRATVEAMVSLEGDAQRAFEAGVAEHGIGPWEIPLVMLKTTAQAALAGSGTLTVAHMPVTPQSIRVGAQTLEVASVAAGVVTLADPLPADVTEGAEVTPLVEARLSDMVSLSRMLADSAEASVGFTLTAGLPGEAATLPQYRDHPVLEWCHNWAVRPTFALGRVISRVDPLLGVVATFDHPEITFPERSWSILTENAQDTADLFGLLYAMAGAMNGIWVPSGGQDVFVDGEGVGWLDITAQGQTLARRDIRIRHPSGAISYRRLTGITEPVPGIQRLALDSNLPETAIGAQVSFMALSRMTADLVRLTWWVQGAVETELSFRAYAHDF